MPRVASEDQRAAAPTTADVATFCPLCVSRCGAKARVDGGEFVALLPDPGHPTGQALCVKGRAAPQIVRHPDRLRHPLRRTRPKGAADPGWQRISWDEALDTVAERLQAVARESGPEAVVFGSASPSTSAMSDSVDWLLRLRRAFGSPNLCASMELCGWGRYLASLYTFGEPVPGAYMPDLDRAGCILFWGYNPSVARLTHATATAAALRRGARLVVVDPRRVGLAAKADQWLQVRPGTDAALALALAHVMIERRWFDEEFVRRWTNAPLLVRPDGRLLRGDDGESFVAWDAVAEAPVRYDPSGGYDVDESRLLLTGERDVVTPTGSLRCRPVFDLLAERCRSTPPTAAERITGVPAEQIVEVARLLWAARPVAFYTWSGLEQQSNVTQTTRSIDVLYALTGSLDAPGGNVLFAAVPANRIDGAELISAEQRAKALGAQDKPLGPARFEFTTGPDFYRAALDAVPYRARALVNFGANLVMAHAHSGRGQAALAALDFMVHADLFLSPTAELADIVLPVAGPFESEALRIGFESDQAAQAWVQLRPPVVAPPGEARSDLQIIFALAERLGLGDRFFGGDVQAGFRHQLAPSGLTLEELRASPQGVAVPLTTTYRKFAAPGPDGRPRGFRTPSGRIELYSETFARSGYDPLPGFTEPGISPASRPDLAQRFPLVLTCAKALRYCESQHRQIAALREPAPDPLIEVHPATAAARGISAGEWALVETPHGDVRARVKLNAGLDPGVVCGQHGWWQACDDLGLPGYPVTGDGTANLNAVLRAEPADPISGSAPLRASLCEVAPLT